MSEDQDLVKALDSVAGAVDSVGGVPTAQPATTATATLEPVVNGAIASPFPSISPATPSSGPIAASLPGFAMPDIPTPTPAPEPTPPSVPAQSTPDEAPVAPGPLDSIKKDALSELRPLVGKLNLSPEEKFDTYLLLIRSTDDAELIAPAHEAAKAIPDETRRAEALLDIVKEIDYLSQPKQDQENA